MGFHKTENVAHEVECPRYLIPHFYINQNLISYDVGVYQ